jgi:glycine cleavage system aminomethyltransferase T
MKKVLNHSPFVPYDEKVGLYVTMPWRNYAIPYEYTGWREETMAWKETCYIHGNLNPSPTFRVKGPDAIKFLSEHLVNGFMKFPIGTGRHGIMCNNDGLIISDGVLLRTGEDEFISYWMAPYITYAFQKGDYNAVGETLTGKVFLFQVAGPRSLEILESASGDDLHDIRFMHHQMTSIDGMNVRVLRLGMAGTLSYELHGDIEDAHAVYNAILKAGESYGIRKLGYHAYLMNHTEDGFPQAYYHFPYPWAEDKGFMDYISAQGGVQGTNPTGWGSMGPDMKLRYRNPVELGWEKTIKFDHDFVGREVLEKLVAEPNRKMVTLVWNKEDLFDIYKSQFELGEPYANMDEPYHFRYACGQDRLYADQVLKDGKLIGISSGRAYSYRYREMISLCSIAPEFSELGTEVTVLWGDAGSHQKEIKATVSRFPFLDEGRNETVDVSTIPRPVLKK